MLGKKRSEVTCPLGNARFPREDGAIAYVWKKRDYVRCRRIVRGFCPGIFPGVIVRGILSKDGILSFYHQGIEFSCNKAYDSNIPMLFYIYNLRLCGVMHIVCYCWRSSHMFVYFFAWQNGTQCSRSIQNLLDNWFFLQTLIMSCLFAVHQNVIKIQTVKFLSQPVTAVEASEGDRRRGAFKND